jgi:hypothetical protein
VSWPDNYCEASKFIYRDDGRKLVQDPDILERDPAISIQASLWYWMTQSGPQEGNPFKETSAHDCMVNFKGLGCTIWAINGALECNNPKRAKEGPAQVKSRGENYERIKRILGRDKLGDGKWPATGPNAC